MNNYKEHKVVLVPTEDQSEIWSHKGRRLYYNQTNLNDPDDEIRYHLYILSDEAVGVENIIYHKDHGVGKYSKKEGRYCFKFKDLVTPNPLNVPGVKKIIAGTNKKLNTAKIPESFIEQYCNNPVDKVMVEYKYIGNEFVTKKDGYSLNISTDNEITIKPAKDSWKKEEVIEIIEEVMSLGYNYHKYGSKLTITQELEGWIKENL